MREPITVTVVSPTIDPEGFRYQLKILGYSPRQIKAEEEKIKKQVAEFRKL